MTTKDPHHDAYLSELALIVEPLKAFRNRVEANLASWPEHATLQRLLELSDKLASIHLSSPLMRWLVGLEALLGKADEWESVASSEVSLRNEMHALSRFVVRWRKLELESWASVLDRRERDARKKTTQWWFQLHELLEGAQKDEYWSRNPTSWIKFEMLEEQLGEGMVRKESLEIFDILDQFLRTSTLGDFPLRIDLLYAFAGYVKKNNGDSANALSITLENLASYYGQFKSKVKNHLENGRAPIQAKLTDHVKIATWDDRNYFALRESAEKSHRVVHKLARAFDEVLESPAHPAMEGFANETSVFETPEDLAKAPPTGSKAKFPKHWLEDKFDYVNVVSNEADVEQLTPLELKRDVNSVARRARKLIETKIKVDLDRRIENGGSSALELDEDARERLSTLTKESPTQLKKRALIDFFSELKSHGLLDGPIPKELRDARTVLATNMRLCKSSNNDTRFGDVDEWLFRSYAQLTRLRRIISSPDRSKDLSQDECTRGMKACEMLMLNVLKERQVLVNVLHVQRKSIKSELERLNLLSTANKNDTVDSERVIYQVNPNASVGQLLDSIILGVGDLNFLLTKLAPKTPAISTTTINASQSEWLILKERGLVFRQDLNQFKSKIMERIVQLGDVVRGVVKPNRVPSCDALLALFSQESITKSMEDLIFQQHEAVVGDELSVEKSKQQATQAMDGLVEKCMLTVQSLNTPSPATSSTNEKENNNNHSTIAGHHRYLLSSVLKLDLNGLVTGMKRLNADVLLLLSRSTSSRLSLPLDQLVNLLSTVLAFGDELIEQLLSFHSSLCRLTYFCLAIFRTLCEKGFCRPPEEDEEGANGQGEDENMREGTGMGEGEGRDNVSKEIEDEEQMLGLKGEEQSKPNEQDKKQQKKNDEEEEDGMEMENDFEGGEMHDVEPDKEDEEEDEDNKKDEEEEEELDREMGDLGEQQQVVDERMWNSEDEDGEDEQDREEKFEKDAPMDGPKEDSDELRAKDDENDEEGSEKKEPKKEEDSKQEKKKKNKKEDKEEPSNKDEENNEEGKINKPEDTEEHHDIAEKEVFTESEEEADDNDDNKSDGEDEDFKDQDVGEDEEEGGGDGLPPDNENEQEQNPEDFEMPAPELDGENGQDQQEDDEPVDEEESSPESDEGENGAVEPLDEDKSEEPPKDENQSKLSLPAGANQNENEEQQQQEEDVDKQGNASGTNKSSSRDQLDSQMDMESRPPSENQNGAQSENLGDQSSGTTGQRYQRGTNKHDEDNGQQEETSRPEKDEPNPWRDPGDATREWTRRVRFAKSDGAMDVGDDETDDEGEDDNHGHQEMEYTDKRDKNEKGEENFQQALGVRGEDDVEPLNLAEEKDKDEPEEPPKKSQKDKEEQDADKMDVEEDQSKKKPSNKSAQNKKIREKKGFFDDMEEEDEEDEKDDESIQDDLQSNQEQDDILAKKEFGTHILNTTASTSATTLKEVPEPNVVPKQVTDDSESAMESQQVELGQKAWNDAAAATHEMAQRLCEQLRLVLEPTQASKLQGDYRTGKRINMRRVIPFIASQFRKDKIWLRRTKPSRRRYHVALAIDDSKSMRPARKLALAALALISRALTQLEVGDIGVWSFGNNVRKLHDLGQPFSDIAGAKVAARFGFDQDSTCIEDGLGAVIEALTEAANNAPTTGNLVSDQPKQLAFVVSDGRFDTGLRPRMARWLRIARERKQLIALIVVEPPGGESILELKQVSFTSGGIGGMKVNRYLEDYPFPYYIVLRDMAVLPEVLADGLRQWFELVANEEK